MTVFSQCEDAIDRLQAKLEPITSIMEADDQPIGYGFDPENNPRVSFKSEQGIAAFHTAVSALGPNHCLSNWMTDRSPHLFVHPKYATSYL